MPELELTDIQGLVARGYASLRAAAYLLLSVEEPGAARAWLASAADRITPASERPEVSAAQLAFTAPGLLRLGLSPAAVATFSTEFAGGMTAPHRRRLLGDHADAAPEEWLWGGPRTDDVHLLLALFAVDDATLLEHVGAWVAGFSDGGLREILRLDAMVDLDGREHFGFRDGISQPIVEGLSSRVGSASNTIRAGEVILGYPNEYGLLTDRPMLGDVELGKNGSYLVFRHLSQDVHAFWRFLDRAADGDRRRRARLAGKMVGRWPGGAPLTLAPEADDPSLADANDFAYYREDAAGLSCPVGAHIRRAHPRDSLDPDPGTPRSVAVNKRHRLLRRGREYGPPAGATIDEILAAGPDGVDRGIFFICLVGNIARQFELVQHTWLNNPKFDRLYEDPDPLVGARGADAAAFSIPADPVRERVVDMPAFVRVRGGGYFFLPGLRALRYLSNLSNLSNLSST